MAHGEAVRVQPEAMHVASQALSSAAKDLHARLVELNGNLRDLLAGWQGGSGGAYAEAWSSWHGGASEVQQGLSLMARAVAMTGVGFTSQEQTSAQTVKVIYRG